MSRQADREGSPEVAEAYKRIAFEEAEHASKFAELLGDVVAADTKANLKAGVEAEHGVAREKRIWQPEQNSLIMTQYTIRFMKCVRTKLATARHLPDY